MVFTGSTGDLNAEPWISDGTAAGTHQIADVYPRQLGALNILSETTIGSDLVFLATTSNSLIGGGPSLWVSDGTAGGTTQLALYAGASQVISAGGKLYVDAFLAGNAILVTSDLSIAPSVLGGGDLDFGAPSYLTAFNGKLFFYEYNLGGATMQRFGSPGLFATDGTDAGTALVSNATVLAQPLILGSSLVFYGGAQGSSDAGLFKTDGAAASTVFLGALPTFILPSGLHGIRRPALLHRRRRHDRKRTLGQQLGRE